MQAERIGRMKWSESSPRAYYKNYERVDVKNDQGWFEVYELPGEVFAICEPRHFQEVNSYLILGREKALLFDTGLGFCNIKPLVEELAGGRSVAAVNSHCHADHIGNNWRFEPVLAFSTEASRQAARCGRRGEQLGDQLKEEAFRGGYPEGFLPEEFQIPPYRTEETVEGDRIDLGGRTLQVIHTPGHSEDSIMLYDGTHRILFTGDTFYLAALYAHFDEADLPRYRRSLLHAREAAPEAERLYCSHNELSAGVEKLTEAAGAMEWITSAESEGGAETEVPSRVFTEGGTRLIEYFFDGFSVVRQAR